MEIGSFIELQFPKGKEYYSATTDIARLNSGRCAIYHALRVLSCDTVWLPFYQCDTVRAFLGQKGIQLKYYHIDSDFNPIDLSQGENEAVVFVNYYGIMSAQRMRQLCDGRPNVIVDNAQGFFAEPVENAMNVYSARKFVGVPDGAYVIGRCAEQSVEEYEQGYSSDTSLFLLQRIEYGCEGKTYASRGSNENRINAEDIMKMSPLTRTILDAADYDIIRSKRRENFETACCLFRGINQIDPQIYYDKSCVPMVYPLVSEEDGLLERLLQAKHFQGHWWSYLCDELKKTDFEYWLSRYIVPITIDQRYGEAELRQIREVIG